MKPFTWAFLETYPDIVIHMSFDFSVIQGCGINESQFPMCFVHSLSEGLLSSEIQLCINTRKRL
jgi:hypothetical protein